MKLSQCLSREEKTPSATLPLIVRRDSICTGLKQRG